MTSMQWVKCCAWGLVALVGSACRGEDTSADRQTEGSANQAGAPGTEARAAGGADAENPSSGAEEGGESSTAGDASSSETGGGGDESTDAGDGSGSDTGGSGSHTGGHPGLRHLELVRALEGQGFAGSICPKLLEGIEQTDPAYGYNPAFMGVLEKLDRVLE